MCVIILKKSLMLCHHAYIIDNLNTRFLLVSFSACLLYILDCIHIALILSFLLYACSQSISNAFSCYIHYVTCSVWIGTQHSNCSLWFSFAKGYALEDTPSWMPLVNRVSEILSSSSSSSIAIEVQRITIHDGFAYFPIVD